MTSIAPRDDAAHVSEQDEAPATAGAVPRTQSSRHPDPSGPHEVRSLQILVVDDDPRNLTAIEVALEGLSAELVMARSGTEALRHLLEREFALILLDVQMPGLDGFATARLIRERARSKHIPIIFVTAHHQDDREVLRGYELGAVDFLFKPIDPHILRHKADVFSELFRQRQLLSQQVRERERLLEETRETLRLNEMFTAALSHDLRTPLNAVVAGAALLTERAESALTTRIAERILSSGRRMTEMIEQLLDLSRARLSGGIAVDRQPMDLRTLTDRIVAEAQATAPQRSIQLRAGSSLTGNWDEGRLGQVVSNLVTNAIRHGAAGPIVVTVAGDEPSRASLSVQNGGVIPERLRAQLFDPFRGADDAPSRSEGLGLGLYIVKQIVDAHGGSI